MSCRQPRIPRVHSTSFLFVVSHVVRTRTGSSSRTKADSSTIERFIIQIISDLWKGYVQYFRLMNLQKAPSPPHHRNTTLSWADALSSCTVMMKYYLPSLRLIRSHPAAKITVRLSERNISVAFCGLDGINLEFQNQV